MKLTIIDQARFKTKNDKVQVKVLAINQIQLPDNLFLFPNFKSQFEQWAEEIIKNTEKKIAQELKE